MLPYYRNDNMIKESDLQTLEDIKQITTWFTDNPDKTWKNIKVEDLRDVIKKWIKFLELQGAIAATNYPRGAFQAEILRKIFNIE